MRALLPFGLWVPVLPGTRQVTVGGAIAADVHGKNHHTQGSFGNHVRSLDLLMADGEVRTVTPDGDTEALFWATVGGMGLTGAILGATVALQRTETAYFTVDTHRAANIDDLMQQMSEGDENYTYSVAWFDAVTKGRHMGRGVLTRGNKARLAELPTKLRRDPLKFVAPSLGTLPEIFPNRMINKATAKAFSTAWYQKAPKHRTGELQNITKFFHPLDMVAEWNRVYGPHGFLQYQFVVPFEEAEAFRRCLEMIVSSGHLSCLNVLKRFGPGNPSPLSFPMPGWTLTVDLPIEQGLDKLCDALDNEVVGAGGRVYLAKDSRLSAAMFRQMYPRLDDFLAVRREVDPTGMFNSDLARRLELSNRSPAVPHDQRGWCTAVATAARRHLRHRFGDRPTSMPVPDCAWCLPPGRVTGVRLRRPSSSASAARSLKSILMRVIMNRMRRPSSRPSPAVTSISP